MILYGDTAAVMGERAREVLSGRRRPGEGGVGTCTFPSPLSHYRRRVSI